MLALRNHFHVYFLRLASELQILKATAHCPSHKYKLKVYEITVLGLFAFNNTNQSKNYYTTHIPIITLKLLRIYNLRVLSYIKK